MTRNNADFYGYVNVPMSDVEEFIPADYDDGDVNKPVRMKNIDRESCANYDSHDEGYYDELKADIAKHGIKDPIEATQTEKGNFLLTEGHHRVIIARELGLHHIPVIFR